MDRQWKHLKASWCFIACSWRSATVFPSPLCAGTRSRVSMEQFHRRWSPSIFLLIPGHYTNLKYWSRKRASDKLLEEVKGLNLPGWVFCVTWWLDLQIGTGAPTTVSLGSQVQSRNCYQPCWLSQLPDIILWEVQKIPKGLRIQLRVPVLARCIWGCSLHLQHFTSKQTKQIASHPDRKFNSKTCKKKKSKHNTSFFFFFWFFVTRLLWSLSWN